MDKCRIILIGSDQLTSTSLMSLSQYLEFEYNLIDLKSKIKQEDGDVVWFILNGQKMEEYDEYLKKWAKKLKHLYLPIIIVIDHCDQKTFVTNKHYVQMLLQHYKLTQINSIIDSSLLYETTFKVIGQSNSIGLKYASLKRKRMQSQAIVTSCTSLGIVVASLNLTPIPDATFLAPIEAIEIRGIAKIYEIETKSEAKEFIDTLIQMGTIGLLAKKSIEIIKTIPGLTLSTSLLNGMVAGVIITLLGESSNFIFEQIYLGNKTLNDIRWAQDYLQSQLTQTIIDQVLSKIKKQVNTKTKQN